MDFQPATLHRKRPPHGVTARDSTDSREGKAAEWREWKVPRNLLCSCTRCMWFCGTLTAHLWAPPFSEEGKKPCHPLEVTELKGQRQGRDPSQADSSVDPLSTTLSQKACSVYATEKHPWWGSSGHRWRNECIYTGSCPNRWHISKTCLKEGKQST